MVAVVVIVAVAIRAAESKFKSMPKPTVVFGKAVVATAKAAHATAVESSRLAEAAHDVAVESSTLAAGMPPNLVTEVSATATIWAEPTKERKTELNFRLAAWPTPLVFIPLRGSSTVSG